MPSSTAGSSRRKVTRAFGREATNVVVEAGSDLRHQYPPGLRLAVQPDIYIEGRSTAFRLHHSGGLVQYHLIGPEILDADDGAYYVIPVDDRPSVMPPPPFPSLGPASNPLLHPAAPAEPA